MRISLPNPPAFEHVFTEITGVQFDKPVTGITINSQNVQSGDLFIALQGERVDGHQFIRDVADKGAVASLVKHRNGDVNIQQIEVDDPLTTIGTIAHHWRNRFDIPVIGITGSNGKTSTKELLKHIFSPEFTVHATEANYNTSISLPLTLLTMTNEHSMSIIEMGASVPGDISYLCKIAKPTHGLITNIAPAHLDGFKTIENVAREKGELFNALESGIAFVNQSDDHIQNLNIPGESISYGFTPNCDFPADIFHDEHNTISLIIDSIEIHTNSQNISFAKNVLACAAVAKTMDVDWDMFQEKIYSFAPPSGRCEIKQANQITVIDDTYNANLESALSAIDFLSAFATTGKRYFIFGDMFELGEESIRAHQHVGIKCAGVELDGVFTVGDLTRHTHDHLPDDYLHQHFSSKEECNSFLKTIIKPGDAILIKGSRGMAMETIVKELTR